MSNKLSARRSAALMSVAALATSGLIATGTPAGAAITAGGGETAEGIPATFQDDRGVVVQLCTDAARCAEAAEPEEPGGPGGPEEPVFPEPGSEAMYFAAETMAGPLLAIYAVEAVVDETGEAEVFNVARFRARDLTPGASYTIKGPFGTVTAVASDTGRIEELLEVGAEEPGGHVTHLLRQPTAPDGFLGDFAGAPARVTGSPIGFNKVELRSAGGALLGSTDVFAIAGQMADDTAMTWVDTRPVTLGSIRTATPSTARIPVESFGTATAAVTATASGADPGAFTIVNNCGAAAPGSTCDIEVTYTPQANLDRSAWLTIDDNGVAAPRQVALTGIAHDTRAPRVVSRTPAKGATVRPGANVKATFSEAVRGVSRSSFTLVNAKGRRVRAAVSRRGGGYVLNPVATLARKSRYTVKLDGGASQIRDVAGNPARDVRWSFRTR